MDGANIEIREETGEDKMLTFGLLTPEIDSERSKMKHWECKVRDDCLSEAICQIRNDMYCGSDTSRPILTRNSINLLSSGVGDVQHQPQNYITSYSAVFRIAKEIAAI